MGPTFAVADGQVTYEVIGESGVAVPTGFYKLVVDVTDPDVPGRVTDGSLDRRKRVL